MCIRDSPWFHGETLRDGLLREKARAEHDRRIRRVRAGRDRRDDDGAVGEVVGTTSVLHGYGPGKGAERCGHPAVAALIEPLRNQLRVDVRAFLFQETLQICSENFLRVLEWHAVLRAARARERGLDGREVQLDDVRELRSRRRVGSEQALL